MIAAIRIIFLEALTVNINPYASPQTPVDTSPADSAATNADFETAKRAVGGPSTGLIVLSGIMIPIDIVGLANELVISRKLIDNEAAMLWFALMVAANGLLSIAHVVIFIGAIRMRRLTVYSTARIAAIASLIPLLSPMVFLGIPFGIWSLTVLQRPKVRAAFKVH